MPTVQVRYIVHDVNAAIEFYTKQLGSSWPLLPEARLGSRR